ncbi:hypothetical protein TWF102_005159 [Orbilia oligospora]|uniref:Uncharacterized protein n=1 Tax=Orbilia oligospora TaxID=2813651 RepID=A0A7C8ND83_ORBOL|nr:hypothetical protein TWF102_005159 [Orbilia oligospora]
MFEYYLRLPFWAQVVVASLIMHPAWYEYQKWRDSRDNCKCAFCTKFTEKHKIRLQELREAGHAVKMPPGYYTVDYTPASASLKDEEVELEFENAFRKMRYTWCEEQDSELLQNGRKALRQALEKLKAAVTK